MLLLGCAREKREESTSHEVYLSNVGTVLGVPIVEFLAVRMEEVVAKLLCVLACGSELASCVDTGVVDENVEVLLFRLNLLDKALDLLFVRNISDERDDLARNILAVHLNNGCELVFSTADNVDLGTIDGKGLNRLEDH